MKKVDREKKELVETAGVKGVKSGLKGAALVNDFAPAGQNLNILFILTDQERYFRSGELPVGYRLPAHERLAARGTVFENHRINSCVCTPSRSVIYTGRHIQETKMFDNTNFPWISSMSTDLPTRWSYVTRSGLLHGVQRKMAPYKGIRNC